MPLIGKGQFWRLLDIDENNPEYELFSSLIEEFTEVSGWPVKYYIKTLSTVVDPIYGEDANAEYTNGFSTRLIYEPTEENNILDSFGITSDETISYMQMPKSLFEKNVEQEYQVGNDNNTQITPKPGDCIRTMWNNKLYEIVEIGSEQKIFQGKKMIWEFITRPYRHSEESDSATNMLDETPLDIDFPDINTTTTTKELSAYGDNDDIDELADDIEDYDDIDSSHYGY